jgi:hypothetical protein
MSIPMADLAGPRHDVPIPDSQNCLIVFAGGNCNEPIVSCEVSALYLLLRINLGQVTLSELQEIALTQGIDAI